MSAILLPIKPPYIEQILHGEKKYEYRKRLCKKEINKIYLYATNPVKKVVGEVTVISKLETDKETLWKITKQYSGVSYEEYCDYFSAKNMACAYQLGEIIKYNEPKPLTDYGIDFCPQSFLYIDSNTAAP